MEAELVKHIGQWPEPFDGKPQSIESKAGCADTINQLFYNLERLRALTYAAR